MIDIEKIQQEIVECLKPLKPEKVILFGSYANGTANEDSDIDLFLVKDAQADSSLAFELKVRRKLRDLIYKYQIGFDVLSASKAFLESREDYFYKMDILKNGKVIYVQ
jgi:predicted nucleotidyltransferase